MLTINKINELTFIKRGVLIFILMLINSLTYAQQTSIQGTVTNEKNAPIEYFDAIIRSVKDSSMIRGDAFMDGKFNFQNLKPEKYILQLSSVGFITKYLNFNTKKLESINVGTVILHSLILKEVNVVAKRPVVTMKDGNLVVDVKHSSLSNAGTLMDVLNKSPGVIVDKNNNITILGKGSPVIYINGKEVQSKSELDILQSDDIQSIEIDRNPSAEYSASGHAALKITTKKITTDKLNILVFNYAHFGRRYSNTTGIELNSKINKLSNYFSYSYKNANSTQSDNGYVNNYLPNDTILNRYIENTVYNKKSHNIFCGVNYQIDSNNVLGLQFSSSFSKEKDTTFSDYTIENVHSVTPWKILNYEKNNNRFYDLNLNYKSQLDSITTLSIVADYARMKLTGNKNISERNKLTLNKISTKSDNSSLYSVYTGRADVDGKLFKSWKTKIGAKYSLTENNGKNKIESQNTIANFVMNNNIKDQVTALYITVNKKLNKFDINAGVRYEYTLSKITITDSATDFINRSYHNFFPSLLFGYKSSDNFNVSLSYSKRISRPSFEQLNPRISYLDSLSYSIGNPLLKPTLSDNFELGLLLFKHLSVIFDYTKQDDRINQVAISDENNPHITKYAFININKAEFYSASISYNFSKKFYTNYTSFNISKPFIKVPYLNATRIIQKPVWTFQMNNEFIILKNTTFYVDFDYESSGDWGMTYWGKSYNLSAGIYTKLFNKKLFLSLAVNDLLRTYTYSWHDKYANIESGEMGYKDTRWLKITVKYNFNQFKNIFEKKSSNKQDLNRL